MDSLRTWWLLVPIALVALTSCSSSGTTVVGSGNVQAENRAVSGISGVIIEGIGELTIRQTGTESLTIAAEANLLPYITTTVIDGVLTIKTQDNIALQAKKAIGYLLTVKDLQSLTVSGAASVLSADLKTATLALKISGVGNANLTNLTTTTANTTISGAGSVTISGQTVAQTVNISGTGSYQGDNFTSQTATLTLSGIGNAAVNVSDALTVKLSGIGNVTYSGSPKITQNISGVGRIQKK